MKTVLRLFCTLALIALFSPAFAQVINGNANAVISPVGPTTFRVALDSVLPQKFTIRVVDTAGQPIAGIAVWYFVDAVGHVPEQPDPSPPFGTYGSFDWPTGVLLQVRTDSSGIAAAPSFKSGSLAGSYNVAGGVYPAFDPQSTALIGGDSMSVSFHIDQVAGGLPATVGAPTLSLPATLLLIGALALLAVRRRHTLANTR